jgi:hypothetical protein
VGLYLGPIPESIGDLGELLVLNLGDNKLTGTIPDSMTGMKKITSIILSGNQLSGGVPNLRSLEKLRELWLQENNFSNISESVVTMSQHQLVFMTVDNQRTDENAEAVAVASMAARAAAEWATAAQKSASIDMRAEMRKQEDARKEAEGKGRKPHAKSVKGGRKKKR